MFQALINTAGRVLTHLHWRLRPESLPGADAGDAAPVTRPIEVLKRVVLTDEVSRTLFDEYAAHRKGTRGDEEIGWVLLGVREPREAIVLATLPAGAQRNAGVAHVRFNARAQALASRIVRQADRRLRMLGVLHTHPGSLRHPSDGDYDGDSQWVGRLHGGEGIFGIGTADATAAPGTPIALQPQAHVQCLGELRFSWYALKEGDKRYRPVEVGLTLGPDLARVLHPVWATIEKHAEPLERLAVQQASVKFEVMPGPALGVAIRLADGSDTLRLEILKEEERYYVIRGNDAFKVDPQEKRIDRGVYLLLAELAKQAS
jgi:proteasome lid subunit RPN8/RPN11